MRKSGSLKKTKLMQNQLETVLSDKERNPSDSDLSNSQLVSLALEHQAGTLLISSLFPFAQIALDAPGLPFPLLKEPNVELAAKGAFALLQSNGEVDPREHSGEFLRFANQILRDNTASLEGKWYALHAACNAVQLSEEATWKLFVKHFPQAKAWWNDQPQSFEEIKASFFSFPNRLKVTDKAEKLAEQVVDFDGIPMIRIKPSVVDFNSFPMTCRTNLKSLALALHSTSFSTSSFPVLIRGLAGCGKTWTVRTLAALLGQELIELQLDDQMDSKTLLGSMSCVGQKFTWVPGTLTRAIAEGKWVLIEDLDSAPVEILTSLKPLFETGELGLPNRSSFYPLRAHSNFRVFATSRKRQESFLVHRVWKNVDILPLNRHELITVCLNKFTKISNSEIVKQIVDSHFDLNANIINGDLAGGQSDEAQNIRDLFKWLVRVEAFCPEVARGFVPERQKEMLIREGVEVLTSRLPLLQDRIECARKLASLWQLVPEVGNKLVEFIKPEFKYETNKVWSCGRVKLLDFPKSRLPQEIESFAATSVSLKTLEQIAGCVFLNEPCLLVGETGCGKTSMIQLLSKCCGKQLVVQNMHVQSDATEFLGGFKPSPSLLKEGLVLHDRFLNLFSFDKLANAPFLLDVQRSCENQTWKRFCKALEDACKKYFKSQHDATRMEEWTQFAADVAVFKNKIHVNFSFIEGALIRAIRNGDWLLLDEVNLASGETLERLLPLLEDSKSSISLTERGDSTPIPRHPGFRLFAAMNPSTDFGKKNLPTAFRSRFSEFYVDEVNEETDLTMVVSQFLQPDSLDLVDAVVQLFVQSKHLSRTVLFDGSGQSPRYSLRTLVRTLQSARLLATNQGQFGMPRSLYESFCAHFTTCLDEKCANMLMNEATKLVIGTKLHQYFSAKQKPSDLGVQHKKDRVKIGPYYVPIGTLKPIQDQASSSETIQAVSFVLTNHVKQNLVLVARAVAFRKYPILLQGPTSAGKTSLITHLAALTGNRVLRINNHEHTDLQEYVGSYVSDEATGKLKFHYGVLVEALQKGYWVILDELNLAPSDVLEALNRLLDDNRELFVMETQEVIVPHPNFLLFATQNPPSYGGRKQLSRAFRNRFLEIHFGDIPYIELEEILKLRSRLPESFTVKMVNVMRELQLRRSKSQLFAGKTGLITPRDLLRWADRQPSTYQDLAEQGYRLLGERLRTVEERLEVQHVIETCCGVKLDLDNMYFSHSPASQSDMVWTRSMRRVFSLVHACVLNREPVLLVGDTGLGKTKCIAAIAECFGNSLTVLNCHQNTETADILGNLRPVRHTMDNATSGGEEDKNKLFEWSDGPLVRTMRQGNYFLLDEISLAEDAVLERLNSVLEPGRTLTLAERAGGTEVDEIVAKDEFRIFATMNPGGDFGKRELSPALRNRFTEIWIPSDVLGDADLVLQYVMRIHPLATELACNIVQFASWFNDHCGTSLQPLSIRDLIAWAEFTLATLQGSTDADKVQEMFAHGCFLTVLDGLGVGAGGTQRAFKETFIAQCREAFPKIFAHAKPTAMGTNNNNNEMFGIAPFFISRLAVVPVSFEFEAVTTQLNLFRVLRALQLPRRAVLLEGSPGVGKTSLVSMLAKAIGKNIVRINLSEHTDFSDLIGCDLPAPVDPSTQNGGGKAQKMAFKWSDGVFLKALKRGDWVLLDELNLANQSVLEGLNSVLDHRACVFVPELNQTFDCPSDFRVFACQNPFAQGGGRKGLPKSFLNRFTKVFVEALEEQDYLSITRKVFPHVKDEVLLGIVQSNQLLRQIFSHQQDGGDFNLRDIFRFCSLVGKYPPKVIFDLLYTSRPFFKRRGGDMGIQLPQILMQLEEHDMQLDFDQIVALSSKKIQFGANCVLLRHPVRSSFTFFPPSLTPTLIHLARCVQENWPVLLVGDSGFGKSLVIQHLATLVGQHVRICQMTATTDSTELLGCFEQMDELELKRNLLIELEQLLQQVQHENVFNLELVEFLPKLHLTIGELLVSTARTFSLEECFQSGVQFLSLTKQSSIDLIARWTTPTSNGLGFHWVDGALINAMERGEWLVLDDANLCSPTVLDRLNGLLESDGELMVNEQGTTKDGMRIVRPAPGFRIFLTLDPKYGNVSRAMRNRCVEIGLQHSCYQSDSLDRVLYLENFPIQLQHSLVVDTTIKPHLFTLTAQEILVKSQLLSCFSMENKQSPFGVFPMALSVVDFKHQTFVSNLRVLTRMIQQQHGNLNEVGLQQALLGTCCPWMEDPVLFERNVQFSNAFAILLPLFKRLTGTEELAWLSKQVTEPIVQQVVSLFLEKNSAWKQQVELLSGIKSKYKLLTEVMNSFDLWNATCISPNIELVVLRDDLFRICQSEQDATLLICWRRFCKRIPTPSTNSQQWLHFENCLARFDAMLVSRTGHSWNESKTKWPIWKRGGHPMPPTDLKSLVAVKQLVEQQQQQNLSRTWRRDALAALCVLRYSGAGSGGGAMGNLMENVDTLRDASLATVLTKLPLATMGGGSEEDDSFTPDVAAEHVSKVVKRVLFLLESKVIQAVVDNSITITPVTELKSCERLIELAIQTDSIRFEKLAAFQEFIWNPKSSRVLIHEMLANSLLEPELTQASLTNEISAFLSLPSETMNKRETLERGELMIHALNHFPKSTSSDLDASWQMIDTLFMSTKDLATTMTTPVAFGALESLISSRSHIGKAFALLGFVRFQLFVPPLVDPEKKKQVKTLLFEAQAQILTHELLALRATRRMQGYCPRSEVEAVEQRMELVQQRLAALSANGALLALERQTEFASYAQRVRSFTANFASEDRFVNVLRNESNAAATGLLESFYDTLKQFAQSVWSEDRAMLADLVEPFVGSVAIALHGLRILINEHNATTTSRERELVHTLIAWPRSEPTAYQTDISGLVDASKRAKLNTLLVLLAACEGEAKQDLSQRFTQLTAQWRADRKLAEERRMAKEAQFRIKDAKTPEQENEEAEAKELQAMFPDFHSEFESSNHPVNDTLDAMYVEEEEEDEEEEEEKFAALSPEQVETLVESFIKLYKNTNNASLTKPPPNRDVVFNQCYAAASLLEPNVVIGDNLSDQAVLASNLYALTKFVNELKQ
ncbi:hypothetical protein BASA81_001864 [Batrachochytrium salamandrivorans]|nr:hypothetical protein BASA81_001864 [Batrachochytrium salamandrivorans]